MTGGPFRKLTASKCDLAKRDQLGWQFFLAYRAARSPLLGLLSKS